MFLANFVKVEQVVFYQRCIALCDTGKHTTGQTFIENAFLLKSGALL